MAIIPFDEPFTTTTTNLTLPQQCQYTNISLHTNETPSSSSPSPSLITSILHTISPFSTTYNHSHVGHGKLLSSNPTSSFKPLKFHFSPPLTIKHNYNCDVLIGQSQILYLLFGLLIKILFNTFAIFIQQQYPPIYVIVPTTGYISTHTNTWTLHFLHTIRPILPLAGWLFLFASFTAANEKTTFSTFLGGLETGWVYYKPNNIYQVPTENQSNSSTFHSILTFASFSFVILVSVLALISWIDIFIIRNIELFFFS